MGAFSVTATVTNVVTMLGLKVLVVTGASEAGGASAGSAGSYGVITDSVTPNQNNSLVVFGLSQNTGTWTNYTAATNNTMLDTLQEGTTGDGYGDGYYTGTVTAGSAVTVGASAPTSWTASAAYEVIPASTGGGGTPVVDSSTPALAHGTASPCTTASFSPPGGAVLVAIVMADTSSTSAITMSDTSGLNLTWTQRALYQATYEGLAAIYTATVPGVSWARLQGNSASASVAAGGTATCTYSSALSSGSTMICAVSTDHQGSGAVTGVTDGHGSSFVSIASLAQAGTNGGVSLWALNTPAADVGISPSVTVSFTSAGSTAASILIQEISSLAAGTTEGQLCDGAAGTTSGSVTGSGTAVGPPSYADTAANEYLVYVLGDDGFGNSWTAPSGYTLDPASVNGSGNADILLAYKSSTGGTETGQWTSGGQEDWAAILVAFKLASTTSGMFSAGAATGLGAPSFGAMTAMTLSGTAPLTATGGAPDPVSTGPIPAGAATGSGACYSPVSQVAVVQVMTVSFTAG